MTDWINTKTEMPVQTTSRVAVAVIAAIFDKDLEEDAPGHGYTVSQVSYNFNTKRFSAQKLGQRYHSGVAGKVTHWMYLPAPPEVR